MNKSASSYFTDGCGRCEFYQTEKCKVNLWTNELKALREIAIASGLKEESKWGVPCYTIEGKNVLLLGAFKNYCTLSFIKGSLLKDTKNILQSPGENSQSTKMFKATKLSEVKKNSATLLQYIKEAIELEKKGIKVAFKETSVSDFPPELIQRFKENPKLKEAFYNLTPGRQRGYLIFFSQAKQSETRFSRIDKSTASILKGKGLND